MKNFYLSQLKRFCSILLLVVLSFSVYGQAGFTIDPTSGEGCVPLIVNCFDTSTGANTYFYTITGSGIPPAGSTIQNPGFTFVNPGSYTITQTINIGTPSESSNSRNITVFAFPQAEFTADITSGCAPLSVQFTDLTITPSGAPIISWEWSLGVPAISTLQNPSAIYKNSDSHYITLIVTDSNGCKHIEQKVNYITIGEGTAVIDGITNSCDDNLTTFFNASNSNFTQSDVSTANWVINTDAGPQVFNDELNVGPINYNATGQYAITLTAFDSIGCSDDTSAIVLIGGVNADFKANKTNVCIGEPIQYKSINQGSNLTYNWSFSGGTPATSTEPNPIVTYNNIGNYDVSLDIESTSDGIICNDVQVKTNYITVSQRSSYDFIVDNSFANCPTLTANFELVPQPNLSNGITKIKWYFELSNEIPDFPSSDKTLEGSTFTNVSHIYTQGGPDGVGSYDVSVVIEGNCSDSIYKDDFIFVGGQSGQFNFNKDTVEIGETIRFEAPFLNGTDSILWDLGDGQLYVTSSSNDFLQSSYHKTGRYEVKVFLIKEECTIVQAFGFNRFITVIDSSSTITSNVNMLFQNRNISIYPNPFSHQTILEIKGDLNFNYDILLTDLAGRKVKSYLNNAEKKLIINRDNLFSGLYFINVLESGKNQLLGSYKLMVE